MSRITLFSVLFVLCAAAIFLVYPYARKFLAVDKCLDSGGSYNSETKECEYEFLFRLSHSFNSAGKILGAADNLIQIDPAKVLYYDRVMGTIDTLDWKGNEALCYDTTREESCYRIRKRWIDSMWLYHDSTTEVWIRTSKR
mgnify:CR=1 FL=1|jgi:hypothetical protein